MTTAAADTIYDRLLEQIFSGRYRPGDRLVERQLAEDLGVSRVPVREALTRMVALGVLDGGQKRRSVRLREYTPEEIHRLYQFREAIEGGAVRLAAAADEPKLLKQLEENCQQMALEVGHYGSIRWANLDHAFHSLLARMSRNEWYIATVETLLRQSHFVFYQLPTRMRPRLSDEQDRQWMQQIVDEHCRVLDHVQQRDAGAAEQAMRDHLRLTNRTWVPWERAPQV